MSSSVLSFQEMEKEQLMLVGGKAMNLGEVAIVACHIKLK